MAQWIQDQLQIKTIEEAITTADRKRLTSQGRPGGMAMFSMIPDHEDGYWTTSEFIDELREVLGLPSLIFYDERFPHLNPSAPRSCHICGQTLTRAHAGRCIRNGAVGRVHNICRDTVFQALRAHDTSTVVLEPRNRGNDDRAGPDIEIRDPNFGNRKLDITTTDVRAMANATQDYPARAAEDKKRSSPDATLASQQGFTYMGLGLETSGGNGPGLVKLWSDMWEHVRVKGRHNVWRQSSRTNTLPLSATLDNPIWTAPTITAYWIQKLNSNMRQGLARERAALVDRFATMFSTTSFAQPANRPRTESTQCARGRHATATGGDSVDTTADSAQPAAQQADCTTHTANGSATDSPDATARTDHDDTATATMNTDSADLGDTQSTTSRLNTATRASESTPHGTPPDPAPAAGTP